MSCGYGSCAVVTTNSIFSNPESNFWTSPIFVIVPSNSKEFDEARRVVGLPTRRAAPSRRRRRRRRGRSVLRKWRRAT